jgi:hypothetical protein
LKIWLSRRSRQLCFNRFFVRTNEGGSNARARMLAWRGIAYHFVEFAIAIAAGITASSIALIGFGADSRNRLGSAATVKEASQTQLCAYLSVALLVGLVANAADLEGASQRAIGSRPLTPTFCGSFTTPGRFAATQQPPGRI